MQESNNFMTAETASTYAKKYDENRKKDYKTIVVDIEAVFKDIMDKIRVKAGYGGILYDRKLTYYMSGGESMNCEDAECKLTELFKDLGYHANISIDVDESHVRIDDLSTGLILHKVVIDTHIRWGLSKKEV